MTGSVGGGQQIQEPLDTSETPLGSAGVLELGLGFWASKTLLSAVELSVFTVLAGGPMNLSALSREVGIHERGAGDFFDALTALGMLDRDGGLYTNSPVADHYLDKQKPSYVGGLLEMCNARLYGFWQNLTEALRTGVPQNEAKLGGENFDVLYGDGKKLKQFLGAMTGLSGDAAQALARKFPWGDHRDFADIGCAEGGAMIPIALRNPHLTGIGFDLPPVGPVFRDYVASMGAEDRLTFAPGDFFVDALPSADVIVLGHVLQHWSLDQKKLLIEQAYLALPKGGALVVYDWIIDDQRREHAFGLLMSLNMLIETAGGFDYTGADCRGWMSEAGFSRTDQERLTALDSMVVGFK